MPREKTDEEWAAEDAAEEADRQRKAEPPPVLDRDEFLAWRSPRAVQGGPVRLDNPLWHWLVRTRRSGFAANEAFRGPSPFGAGPMWCFDRFGMSETMLPDGRVLYVGGEHEDSYDPDFFIYNDVVVIAPDGDIAIHGYGREVFPPTDFHSATLIGSRLIIIGCLGYPSQRVVDTTPVFSLDLDTMAIVPLPTRGEAPGWISEHTATLSDDGRTLVVSGGQAWLSDDRSLQENIDKWALNVETGCWTRLSALDWQRWTMRRVDRRSNRIWDTRQELWRLEHAHLGLESFWRHDEAPNFEALDRLYRIDAAAESPEKGSEHNVFVTMVDGVRLRFTEDHWAIHAIVEGRLSSSRLEEFQCAMLATLGQLDAAKWEIEPS